MNSISFLGFSFSPILIQHQEILAPFFQKYPQQLSSYTFASLFGWTTVKHYYWTIVEEETLLIATYELELEQIHLMQPIGLVSDALQEHLLKEMARCQYPVKIHEVSDAFLETHRAFCSRFEDFNDRSLANYLYKAADLGLLEGRRYDRKRNLISQVDKVYQWTVKPLDATCEECPKILAEIGIKNFPDKQLNDELLVLTTVLNNYDRLHLTGYMIGIDGKPVAFSVVDVLNPTTKVVLFEKADRHFKGLYQLINRETSKAIHEQGYEYINREDDLGIEGLRDAKISYHPVELVQYHVLTYR